LFALLLFNILPKELARSKFNVDSDAIWGISSPKRTVWLKAREAPNEARPSIRNRQRQSIREPGKSRGFSGVENA
jgi:hypothetical protein